MFVNLYVYTRVNYYRFVVKYHQLALQANSYTNMWLHNHQQNKTKQNKTKWQWWVLEPDQFCWGARAEINVLKLLKQLITNWWALPLQSLDLIGFLIFRFKMIMIIIMINDYYYDYCYFHCYYYHYYYYIVLNEIVQIYYLHYTCICKIYKCWGILFCKFTYGGTKNTLSTFFY